MTTFCPDGQHNFIYAWADALNRYYGVKCTKCYAHEIRYGPPPPGTHRHRWELQRVELAGTDEWPRLRRLVWRCGCGDEAATLRTSPSHRKDDHLPDCECRCP